MLPRYWVAAASRSEVASVLSHGSPATPRTSGSGALSMTVRDHIRNPAEWSVDQLKTAELAVERAGHSLRSPAETRYAPLPAVRRIELADRSPPR